MTDATSLFKGIEYTDPQRNSEYFRAGRYLTQVQKFVTRTNDQGLTFFIFELLILKVLDPSEGAKDPSGPHGPGHVAGWIMAKHKRPTLSNLKTALMVMTGVPQDKVTPEFCGKLVGNSQPLAGLCIEFENKMISTKAGAPFTRIMAKRKWEPAEVRETVGEEILRRLGVRLEDEEEEVSDE